MTEKNLLLGGGENLVSTSEIIRNGEKKWPYDIEQIRQHVLPQLEVVRHEIIALPEGARPRSEGVFEVTLHPAFLSRSYYPADMLERSGLRDVGSRESIIVPRYVTNLRDAGKALATATLYVAGNISALDRFTDLLAGKSKKQTPKYLEEDFKKIESISWRSASSKIMGNMSPANDSLRSFEVALHAGANEEDIVASFSRFAKQFGANVDLPRKIQVGGLTFVPVDATDAALAHLAQFSFLRVARPMPEIRAALPNIVRKTFPAIHPILPIGIEIENSQRTAIFDGGLGTSDLKPWADEVVCSDTEDTHGSLLMHGNEVTSTFLFGRIATADAVLGRPYSKVDHYRVLSPTSGRDPDLFDVLHRIKSALDTGHYKYANLSLGPRMPIDDGEVHAWTATLDQVCARHGILITVAVGNDGEAEGADRIQPPGDMVNAVCVGAADSAGAKWKKAPYSCIGPGRSPGYVKPDGVAFGGVDKEPFMVYNPLMSGAVGVSGTSYSAPLTLRTAVGVDAITNLELTSCALKALMIHHAESKTTHKRPEVGWGRFRENPMDILECQPGSVTIIFQATLAKGQYRRCPIPFPNVPALGAVNIRATFCIHAHTDPEHAVNYTRSGMSVVFRPRMGINEKDSVEFFGRTSQYKKTERDYRDDAHKWETVLHRDRKFTELNSLADPVFDVEYHARHASKGVPAKSAPDVHFALVVTISAEGVPNIYNLIRQRYPVLVPVEIKPEISVRTRTNQ
ncbi:peptidase S8 [Herbaspirillum rubrisubalbicans]|nr:peptidase S8 [Herbaspirillum rubrisubalbicans]